MLLSYTGFGRISFKVRLFYPSVLIPKLCPCLSLESSPTANKPDISVLLIKGLLFSHSKLHLVLLLYEWDLEIFPGFLGMGCTGSSWSLPKELERLRRGTLGQHLDHRYRAALERIDHLWVLRRLWWTLGTWLVHMLHWITKVSTHQTGQQDNYWKRGG